MKGIPDTWVECMLGDVVNYGATTKAEPADIPADAWILELEDIEKDTSKIIQRLSFRERESKSTKNQFEKGDVLYGKLRPYLNKVVIADQNGFCTTEIIPLKSHNNTLDSRFLFYWLKHPRFLDYVTAVSHGLNMPRLGTDAGKTAPFILAPNPEQKRIADKLEAMLGRIDGCRSRLARVPDILKRFRQSVLAAATSGRLTEDWRNATGMAEQWRDTHLADVADIQGGIMKNAKNQDPDDEELPYLRVANVQRGHLDLTEIKTIRVPQDKLSTLLLEKGDVLFNEGGDIDKLGRGWVWEGQIPRCTFQNHVFRARLRDKSVEPKYISWWGNYRGIDYFLRAGKQTTNLASINKSMLGGLPIRLPSAPEQTEIVRRVEALFAFAERIESRLVEAQTTINRLIPSTLAKAFRGELVPQDTADEPASVLLERIRSQRTAEAAEPRQKPLRSAPKMKKLTQEGLKQIIQELPRKEFGFDELGRAVGADYDQLSAMLIRVLGEKSPILRQEFDKRTKTMRFVRIAK